MHVQLGQSSPGGPGGALRGGGRGARVARAWRGERPPVCGSARQPGLPLYFVGAAITRGISQIPASSARGKTYMSPFLTGAKIYSKKMWNVLEGFSDTTSQELLRR